MFRALRRLASTKKSNKPRNGQREFYRPIRLILRPGNVPFRTRVQAPLGATNANCWASKLLPV